MRRYTVTKGYGYDEYDSGTNYYLWNVDDDAAGLFESLAGKGMFGDGFQETEKDEDVSDYFKKDFSDWLADLGKRFISYREALKQRPAWKEMVENHGEFAGASLASSITGKILFKPLEEERMEATHGLRNIREFESLTSLIESDDQA